MSPGRLRDSQLDLDTAHGSQDAAHALKESMGQQGTPGAPSSDTITWLDRAPCAIFEELGEHMGTCMWAAHVTSLAM